MEQESFLMRLITWFWVPEMGIVPMTYERRAMLIETKRHSYE